MVPDNTNNDLPSNEVDNIRNILFGQQAVQYEERFEIIDKAINSLRNETKSLRQALETEFTEREVSDQKLGQALEAEFASREASDQKLSQTIEALEDKILKELNDLHEKINNDLSQRDNIWEKHIGQQTDLLESLMQSIKGYRGNITASSKLE